MRGVFLLLASCALHAPAQAQHEHHQPGAPLQERQASTPAGPAPAEGAVQADPHAGHVMPSAPPQAQPATPDPHASHSGTPSPPADPHAEHDMGAIPEAAVPPTAAPPPGALAGPAHAADLIFDRTDMAASRQGLRKEHGGMSASKLLVDQAEVHLAKGHEAYKIDAQAWHGGDIDKLWLKSEIEGAFGEAVEKAEVQALWSWAIDPWFDLQAGIRHDFRPDPERTYLVLGIQGLAPYWFEVDSALFVSDKGDVSARLEAEYDLRLTQRLILQPLVELELALQDVRTLGIGSGLSSAEIGARLRYEIQPLFAPYIGVEYERAFGDTADLRRAEGEDAGDWSFVVGLRAWF